MPFQLLTEPERWGICKACDHFQPGHGGAPGKGEPAGYGCELLGCCTGLAVRGHVPCPDQKMDCDISVHIPHTARVHWGHAFLAGAILDVLTQQDIGPAGPFPMQNVKVRILDETTSDLDFDHTLATVEKYWGKLSKAQRLRISYEQIPQRNCGPKRQHLIDTETARISVNFDDDDFYLPGYLRQQIQRLMVHPAPMLPTSLAPIYLIATRQYREQPFFSRGSGSWIWWSEWARDLPVKFTNQRVASDTTFFDAVLKSGSLGANKRKLWGSRPRTHQNIRVHHQDNISTFTRAHLKKKVPLRPDTSMAWLFGQLAEPVAEWVRGEILPHTTPPPGTSSLVASGEGDQPIQIPGLGKAARRLRLAVLEFESHPHRANLAKLRDAIHQFQDTTQKVDQ